MAVMVRDKLDAGNKRRVFAFMTMWTLRGVSVRVDPEATNVFETVR